MEKVLVGVVTKPQALKGAFRIKPSILNFKHFKSMKQLSIAGVDYVVEQITLRDTFVIAKVKGIESCEEVEKIRNFNVYAEVNIDTPQTLDIVNFEVRGLDKLGKITSINNYGSKDILTINFEKECMVPVIDGLIENIDMSSKSVTLNPNIFEEVAVYED